MEQSSQLLRFGRFEADARSGELRKDGRVLRVQEQPFQILLLLLHNQGQVVTREELRNKLWPADTFVDFDHGLNTAINKLREVLGDSASRPVFIQTLARRGYRFLLPVEIVEAQRSNREELVVGGRTRTTALTTTAIAASPAVQVNEKQSVSPTSRTSTSASELPSARRSTVRGLLLAIQTMYLIFYLVALWKLHVIQAHVATTAAQFQSVMLVAIVCTAMIGIAIRLYLSNAVIFDYALLASKFQRLFIPVFILDELWALSPFLMLHKIDVGLALGASAALIYLPFVQRTLVLMAYSRPRT